VRIQFKRAQALRDRFIEVAGVKKYLREAKGNQGGCGCQIHCKARFPNGVVGSSLSCKKGSVKVVRHGGVTVQSDRRLKLPIRLLPVPTGE
jgi:hypothetical protein